jgi:cytoskeleton protein RodZ
MSDIGTSVIELHANPGARLRREREARGMTLQQAAEQLNLDVHAIAALESEDFAALGAPVFAKGHLRRYAAILGQPAEDILLGYERSRSQPDLPTLIPAARAEMPVVRSRPIMPWVLGGLATLLVVGGLIAYLSTYGLHLPWQSRTAAASEESGVTPAPEPPIADAAAVPPDGGVSPEPNPVTAAPSAVATSDPTATLTPPAASTAAVNPPGAVAAAGDAAATVPMPSTTPVPVTAAPNATAVTAGAVPAGQVQVKLRFSADSWVEVYDGTGKIVAYDLCKGGTERLINAAPPVSLTLGNAPAVKVQANGREIIRPALPQGQTVDRFSVGPDGNVR